MDCSFFLLVLPGFTAATHRPPSQPFLIAFALAFSLSPLVLSLSLSSATYIYAHILSSPLHLSRSSSTSLSLVSDQYHRPQSPPRSSTSLSLSQERSSFYHRSIVLTRESRDKLGEERVAIATDCLPAIAMVLVQLGFAGMNVVSKLALDAGMSPYVLIAYRNLIAAAFIAPIAFFFERRSGVKVTKKVLLQILFSSIFGATLNQVLYFVGLKSTTPTIACALTNTLPALTFVMAAVLKMETVRPGTPAGQAKVVGTVICVGGSMIMPFYKGLLLRVWDSPIHWRFAENTSAAAPAAAGHSAAVLGDVLIIASCVACAIWFIIQTKMSEGFSAPYTSTAIMSLMAGVQCAGISAAMDRSLAAWKLGLDIRLYSALYIGIVGSGIAFALISWCIQVRGPLYVSVFSPLLLVVVAIVGWAILGEKIHVGSAVGSVLIVAGLYMVLWGKGREMDRHDDGDEETAMGKGSKGKDAAARSNRDAISLPVSFSTTPKHDTTRNGNNGQ